MEMGLTVFWTLPSCRPAFWGWGGGEREFELLDLTITKRLRKFYWNRFNCLCRENSIISLSYHSAFSIFFFSPFYMIWLPIKKMAWEGFLLGKEEVSLFILMFISFCFILTISLWKWYVLILIGKLAICSSYSVLKKLLVLMKTEYFPGNI